MENRFRVSFSFKADTKREYAWDTAVVITQATVSVIGEDVSPSDAILSATNVVSNQFDMGTVETISVYRS